MPIRATYEVQCDTCGGLLDERFDDPDAAEQAARDAGWSERCRIRCGYCQTAGVTRQW